MDRQSSDHLASEARKIMRQGNPCNDKAGMEKLAADVLEAGRLGGAAAAEQAIKDHFYEYCKTSRQLAASVVA